MNPRGAAPTVSIVVNTFALWLALAIAATVWWPIYQDVHFVIAVAVATALGSLVAIFGAVLRWSSAIVALATIAVFALSGVAIAVPDESLYGILPTGAGLLDLFAGVALGWKQLLTITLPVGSYQALLVPVVVLTLLCAVVGLSVALRARRGDSAVIAPGLLFLTGIAFGPREAHWPIELSLGLLSAVLLWLLWRRWFRRRLALRRLSGPTKWQPLLGLRAVLSALVVMAIAGGAAVLATTAFPPTEQRDVLRTSVEQPFDPRDYASPLAGFRQYLRPATADELLFTVKGLPPGARIRIATLDTYDGIVYSVGSDAVTSESGSFTRVPFRYDQSAVTGDQLSLDVVIDAYSGVWLPTVGKFESVRFEGPRADELRDAFFYNDTASTGALIGGIASGDAYHLDAIEPLQPHESQFGSLTAGAANLPPLVSPPAELATVLERYTNGIDGQGQRLLAMIEGLRAEGYVSHGLSSTEPPSRSGHSSDRITQLLSDQRMIGDAEQYAVTAAVMARELGFPARVVFGFAPDSDSSGSVGVTGSMVSAWIEVNTAQYGWVTIDPTPPLRDIPEEEPEDPSKVSRPQSIVQPPDEELDSNDNQTPVDSTQEQPPTVEPWVVVLLAIARVAGWTLLVVGILISPFVVIIAAKLRRRQLRRKASTPLQRIAGGWREFEDAALDHGFTPPPAATRSEFASSVGSEGASSVAVIADRAIFAPVDPKPEEAAELWQSVDALTAALAEGKTRWQRLRARISVRSLGGRSRPRRRGRSRERR